MDIDTFLRIVWQTGALFFVVIALLVLLIIFIRGMKKLGSRKKKDVNQQVKT